MNCTHYTNILRQCVPAAAWEQSLKVLRQMKRDAIRPDVVGVGCAMACCADAQQPEACQRIFDAYSTKMQLDSQCFLALIKVYSRAKRHREAAAVGALQEEAAVPMLPETYCAIIEAADADDNCELVFEYCRRLKADNWGGIPNKSMAAARSIAERHGRSSELIAMEVLDDERLRLPPPSA